MKTSSAQSWLQAELVIRTLPTLVMMEKPRSIGRGYGRKVGLIIGILLFKQIFKKRQPNHYQNMTFKFHPTNQILIGSCS